MPLPTVQVPRPPLPEKKRRAASTCPPRNDRVTTASCLTARTAPPYKKTEREVVAPTYQDAWSYREGRAAVKKNGRWGYLDNRGKEVVEPRYEQAMPYGEGRAAVKKDGQWGYLDEKGKEIVEPRYDRVWPYKNGRATVQKGGHRSVIDLNGNEILVP